MAKYFHISSDHKNIPIDSKINHNLLKLVEKPARYIGSELNAVIKDLGSVKLHVALAFPDVYEIGMSHLGLKILYSIANSCEDVYAERVFAPWPDMEEFLRESEKPLVTLETRTPLYKFDLIGFSLQYELCATNVLQMLDLGRIPVLASDRKQDDPFVIAGGPICFNPLPMSRFFDAMVIGDGEEVLLEITRAHIDWKVTGADRTELLKKWSEIQGVFVPSMMNSGKIVKKRMVRDLENVSFPSRLVTPICGIAHDRIGIEVARGCTRGCRFCQAGMIYRPVRERRLSTVMNIACESLAQTGWDEISLLSLSTGDYSQISPLVKKLTNEFAESRVAISLPSLRTDTFDSDLAEQIKKVRKTGFTLAPEAGTDRLRSVINKGNTEEDLKKAIDSAFQLGWQGIKLYFMIGLPTETNEDLDGISELISKASKWAKGGTVRASVSTFVPKAHTPFQWARQISMEETRTKQNHLRQALGKKASLLKCHDPRASFLEGVFARGDESLGAVIQKAYDSGARFDGWGDQLKFQVWMDSFSSLGIEPDQWLKERDLDESLPWDQVDSRVSKKYLVEEWNKALSELNTGDCRHGICSSCGVCDFKEIRNRLSVDSVSIGADTTSAVTVSAPSEKRCFRLQFAKRLFMKYVGHHDIAKAFYRAFRRLNIGLAYSQGFHPHPKIRFSPPTGFGIESECELMDFETLNCSLAADEILDLLGGSLPTGLEVISLTETSLNEKSVSANIIKIIYEIKHDQLGDVEFIEDRIRKYNESDNIEVISVRKGKKRTRNIKDWISSIDILDNSTRLTVACSATGSLNPFEAVSAIFGFESSRAQGVEIVKKAVTLGNGKAHQQGSPDGK